MNIRFGTRCDWGGMFGLEPNDLETRHLKKIDVDKLIEMLDKDERVEKIVADKLIKCSIDYLPYLQKLEKEEIKRFSFLVSKYNECIKLREKEIKSKSTCYNSYRNQYILWNLLNNSNKAKEFHRWVKGESSVIKQNKIDFVWLYNSYPYLNDLVVKKIIKCQGYNYNPSIAITKMINDLPEKSFKQYLDLIFTCNKRIHALILSNPFTPREYIIKGLRSIAGKKRLPKINVTLNKSILSELPTVMRLEVLESLMLYYSKIRFEDIKTSEDLEVLLFSSVIRHNARVGRVLAMFKRCYTDRSIL